MWEVFSQLSSLFSFFFFFYDVGGFSQFFCLLAGILRSDGISDCKPELGHCAVYEPTLYGAHLTAVGIGLCSHEYCIVQ